MSKILGTIISGRMSIFYALDIRKALTVTDQYLVVHMMSSIDGRILLERWTLSPDGNLDAWLKQYSDVLETLAVDCYILGSTSIAEMVGGEPHPPSAAKTSHPNKYLPIADADARYAIAFDRRGTLHFRMSTLGADPILVVLGSGVSQDHLSELIADGIGYVVIDADTFSTTTAFDAVCNVLPRRPQRVGLLGGGLLNGSFLAAGLVREISLILTPTVGGDSPSGLFQATIPPNVRLSLSAAQPIGSGAIHLRYLVSA